MIAALLTLVPIIGFVGVVLELVALIFLIISWRALGRSNFAQARNYRSTGRWLLWGVIIVIILAVVGSVVLVASLVASLISHGGLPSVQNGTSSTTTLFQQSGFFTKFLEGYLALFAGVYVIWLVAWIKMSFSVKKLSAEIALPRLNTTGNLYTVEAILGYAGVLATLALITGRASSFPTTSSSLTPFTSIFTASFSGLFLGGIWPLVTVVSLTAWVIMIIASFLGYNTLRAFLNRTALAPPPSAPPSSPMPPAGPTQSQIPLASRMCPKCGHDITNPSSLFCPNCGTKL
jgi:hypothetical protein